MAQDLSLDDIIKTNRSQTSKPGNQQAKPPSSNGSAPKPGGRKGKKGKPAPGEGKAKLGGIQKSNKAKRAMKAKTSKGMDVEMSAPKSGKPRTNRKRGAVAKMADTLKARIQSVVQKRGGKVTPKPGGRAPGGGKPKGGGTPTKAAEIKITIVGNQGARGGGGGGAPGGRGRGRGGGRGGMFGRGRGRGGSIVKPGMQGGSAPKPKSALGGIGKKLGGIQKKARTVIVAGAKKVAGKVAGGRGGRAPGGGGRGGGRGGGGRGGGRGGGGRGGAPRGLTLAQRFKGR
jgi:hypothetical protein